MNAPRVGLVLVGLDGHDRGPVLRGEPGVELLGSWVEGLRVAVPPVLVGGLLGGERLREAGVGGLQGARGVGAEAQREGERGAGPGHRDPTDLRDVAGSGRRIRRRQGVVGGEVGTAVGGADVPGRGGRERCRRDEGGGDRSGRAVAVGGEQGGTGRASRVVARVAGQGRVVQRVQLVRPGCERLEPHVEQDRRPSRVGDVRLGQPPAALCVGVGLPVGQGLRVDEAHRAGTWRRTPAAWRSTRRSRRTGAPACSGWCRSGSRPRSSCRRSACTRASTPRWWRCRVPPCRLSSRSRPHQERRAHRWERRARPRRSRPLPRWSSRRWPRLPSTAKATWGCPHRVLLVESRRAACPRCTSNS